MDSTDANDRRREIKKQLRAFSDVIGKMGPGAQRTIPTCERAIEFERLVREAVACAPERFGSMPAEIQRSWTNAAGVHDDENGMAVAGSNYAQWPSAQFSGSGGIGRFATGESATSPALRARSTPV